MAANDQIVKIEGLREQLRALRSMGEEDLRKTLLQAGRDSAEIVLAKGRVLAPKRSGKLAGSLKTFSNQTAAGVLSRVVYGNPIHWGWLVVGARHKGSLKVGTYRGIKPNPFLAEALGYTHDQVYAEYEAKLDAMIKEKEIRR